MQNLNRMFLFIIFLLMYYQCVESEVNTFFINQLWAS